MKGSLDPEPVLLSRAASVPLPRLQGQGWSHSSLGLHWCSADRRNMLLSIIYTLGGRKPEIDGGVRVLEQESWSLCR